MPEPPFPISQSPATLHSKLNLATYKCKLIISDSPGQRPTPTGHVVWLWAVYRDTALTLVLQGPDLTNNPGNQFFSSTLHSPQNTCRQAPMSITNPRARGTLFGKGKPWGLDPWSSALHIQLCTALPGAGCPSSGTFPPWSCAITCYGAKSEGVLGLRPWALQHCSPKPLHCPLCPLSLSSDGQSSLLTGRLSTRWFVRNACLWWHRQSTRLPGGSPS